jgi:hypothetical protein
MSAPIENQRSDVRLEQKQLVSRNGATKGARIGDWSRVLRRCQTTIIWPNNLQTIPESKHEIVLAIIKK